MKPAMIRPMRIVSYEFEYASMRKLTNIGMKPIWSDIFLPILSVNTPSMIKEIGQTSDGMLAKNA